MSKKKGKVISIDMPLASQWADGEYVSDRIQIGLENDQAIALHKLWRGLVQLGATLKDGRELEKSSDALVWILDQIGAAS